MTQVHTTKPLDVRPAEVMKSPWGKLRNVRVVHADGRLYVVGKNQKLEAEVESVTKQRGTYTATTTDEEEVVYRRTGGCSCGKPWLKGPTTSITG